MKRITTTTVLAFAILFFTGSQVYAGPMASDEVSLSYGTYHYGRGGEFLLESAGDTEDDYAFVTFCLEKQEYFTPDSTYTIDSIAGYAENSGKSYAQTKDYISNATKWLMNEYVFNYDKLLESTGLMDKSYFAGLVQNTIWFFEDEQSSVNESFLTYIMSEMGTDYSLDFTSGYLDHIQVANLVSYNGDEKIYNQSQLIANPVPEPATMLLLGTGLAGLAAVRRRKK